MAYSLFLQNRRQLLTIARITHVGEMVIHSSNTTSVKSHNPYMHICHTTFIVHHVMKERGKYTEIRTKLNMPNNVAETLDKDCRKNNKNLI